MEGLCAAASAPCAQPALAPLRAFTTVLIPKACKRPPPDPPRALVLVRQHLPRVLNLLEPRARLLLPVRVLVCGARGDGGGAHGGRMAAAWQPHGGRMAAAWEVWVVRSSLVHVGRCGRGHKGTGRGKGGQRGRGVSCSCSAAARRGVRPCRSWGTTTPPWETDRLILRAMGPLQRGAARQPGSASGPAPQQRALRQAAVTIRTDLGAISAPACGTTS